ncbi:UDP-N-acetylglucosamine transferase subunit ALG14 isoform 2-like protein [Camelus ferus]|nr:UDP-N-acetylglucosamine transferase subunit ALG14 isoform 2-like protein [Camelus ferus]
MDGALILAAAGGAVAVLLLVRLWVVLRPRAPVPRRSLSLLVVAGSGGHTTEILRLLESLSDAYTPRHYVIADSDEMSARKINSFELNRADRNPSDTASSITCLLWMDMKTWLVSALGLSKDPAHTYLEPVTSSTGQHLVHADDMGGPDPCSVVKTILATAFHHGLVGTNMGSLQGFGGELRIFI